MALFFVGIIEMVIISAWTKYVSESRAWLSGAITMVNIFIWYYVLREIVDNMENWNLVFLYALGCSIGTVIGTYISRDREHIASTLAAAPQNHD